MPDLDDAERLVVTVKGANDDVVPLAIVGAGSKNFLAAVPAQNSICTRDHVGVVEYHPEELVVTARAGTRLKDLASILASQRQVMPFDPPRFGGDGTLGGALATGWSGPARPWLGSARDCVLGVEIVNGMGQRLAFGGRVIKNVAGYDLSRLMVGAFGSLGVILSASFKVLPAPETSVTLSKPCTSKEAMTELRGLSLQPFPITATCHVDDVLHVRLGGSDRSVWHAEESIGGETMQEADVFWAALRDHEHPFFRSFEPLWRLSLPRGCILDDPGSDVVAFDPGEMLTEWSGAQVWWRTSLPGAQVAAFAAAHGGYATPFRNVEESQHIPEPMYKYMKRLKAAFDPKQVLNPGLLF